MRYSAEVMNVLRGDQPDCWYDDLEGWAWLRYITNVLTSIRYCNNAGKYLLDSKGPVGTQPRGYVLWYESKGAKWRDDILFFCHWAALGAGQ